MKTGSTQLEILLMTSTSFSSRIYFESEKSGNQKYFSEKEKLEEACWNGLVNNILPELFQQVANTEPIYLWKISEAFFFLDLEMGELPEKINEIFSINPYSFPGFQSYN